MATKISRYPLPNIFPKGHQNSRYPEINTFSLMTIRNSQISSVFECCNTTIAAHHTKLTTNPLRSGCKTRRSAFQTWSSLSVQVTPKLKLT